MAFLPERIRTNGILTDEPAIFEALGRQLQRNNEAMREVGRRLNVPIVETANLTAIPSLFEDDCHVSVEGHRRRAETIFAVIEDMIRKE